MQNYDNTVAFRFHYSSHGVKGQEMEINSFTRSEKEEDTISIFCLGGRLLN
jgi:hypothetical protein